MIMGNRAPFFLICLYIFINNPSAAQTIPVGSMVFENYYRRGQMLETADSTVSLTIRPVAAILTEKNDSSYHRTTDRKNNNAFFKTVFQVLPFT